MVDWVLQALIIHSSVLFYELLGTPTLYMACEAGMLEAVELMLKKKVKVYTRNGDGYSALHVSVVIWSGSLKPWRFQFCLCQNS